MKTYYELNDKLCNKYYDLMPKIMVKNNVYYIRNIEIDAVNKNVTLIYGSSCNYNTNIGSITNIKGIDDYTLNARYYLDDDNIIPINNIKYEINNDHVLLKID